ncbi:TRAP transporter small permease [Microbacterium sp. G2-8]|uniref:TRAP transporter small permease n=1 Tax=Microbacterium sp. G2-8 TaxID=2842454 RepID=UPI001C8A08D2|nr:TRAP transporter small permease subunit [Microbacterium sp. G2-8]
MADTPSPPPRRPWRAAVRIITGIELTIGVIFLVVVFVLVLFQALQRHLPIDQVAWTGEVSRFCLVWMTFAAAGVLVTTRGHIALEVVDAMPSRTVVRVTQALALLIVAAVAIGLVVEAVVLIDSQGIIKSPVLRIPMSWVYIPLLIGVASTAIRALAQAWTIAVHGPILAVIADDEEARA